MKILLQNNALCLRRASTLKTRLTTAQTTGAPSHTRVAHNRFIVKCFGGEVPNGHSLNIWNDNQKLLIASSSHRSMTSNTQPDLVPTNTTLIGDIKTNKTKTRSDAKNETLDDSMPYAGAIETDLDTSEYTSKPTPRCITREYGKNEEHLMQIGITRSGRNPNQQVTV